LPLALLMGARRVRSADDQDGNQQKVAKDTTKRSSTDYTDSFLCNLWMAFVVSYEFTHHHLFTVPLALPV
ncbi:MAG TPA: hypothetical protein VKA97_02260, partial [Pyrinomonadaceae bacterium]|nr:hypothetical protein [Pyrinomonadaceae bacterium]